MGRSSTLSGLVLLVAVFGLRLLLSLTNDGFLGVDGGAYLLSRNTVLGLEPTGTDFTRPPLAPGWLLVPTTALFGDMLGFNLYAAIFSMPLVIAAWYIGRSVMGIGAGLAMVVLVGFDWVLMGMVVTGVVPLVGFTFVMLASYGMWKIADGRRGWPLIVVSIPLIAFTNQTAAGLSLIVLPVQWLVLPNKRATALALTAGGLVALTALPWYLDATPGSGKLTYPGPLIAPHQLIDHQLWLALLPLYLLFTMRRSIGVAPGWVQASAAVTGTLALMQMFQSHNEVVQNLFFRATYLMMPFLWLLVLYAYAPAAMRWWRSSKLAVPVAAAAVVVLVGVAGQQFEDQAWLSSFADRNIAETIAQIPDDAGTVVTNAYSMALYVAALAKTEVAWTNYIEPPPAYQQTDLDARCTLAWEKGCLPPRHVTHVLIDEKWPITSPIYPKRVPYGAPEDKAYWDMSDVWWLDIIAENGTTKLYQVKPWLATS